MRGLNAVAVLLASKEVFFFKNCLLLNQLQCVLRHLVSLC